MTLDMLMQEWREEGRQEAIEKSLEQLQPSDLGWGFRKLRFPHLVQLLVFLRDGNPKESGSRRRKSRLAPSVRFPDSPYHWTAQRDR